MELLNTWEILESTCSIQISIEGNPGKYHWIAIDSIPLLSYDLIIFILLLLSYYYVIIIIILLLLSYYY